MSTVFTPVFSLSASAVHNVQHTVYDLNESFPSTETAKTDSFNETSILRVKELRADKAGGIVKATQMIVSNRPAKTGDLFTKDNLYEGQQDYQTDFNPANRNSAAFQVISGGAWIGTGLSVNGAITATSATIGSLTAGSFGTVNTTTIDSGANSDLLIKRNGTTIATIASNGVSLPANMYLISPTNCRFSAYGNGSNKTLANTTWTFIDIFGATYENYGNNFNTTTKAFVAPVTGVYIFNMTFLKASGSAGYINGALSKSTTNATILYESSRSGYDGNSLALNSTVYVKVDANTTVAPVLFVNSSSSYTLKGTDFYTIFQGALLYAV